MNKKCKEEHQKHLRNNVDDNKVDSAIYPFLNHRIRETTNMMINNQSSPAATAGTASIASSTEDSYSASSYRRRRRYSKQSVYRRTLAMYDATINSVDEHQHGDNSNDDNDDLSAQNRLIQLLHEEMNSEIISNNNNYSNPKNKSDAEDDDAFEISSVGGNFDEAEGLKIDKASEKNIIEKMPPVDNIVVSLPAYNHLDNDDGAIMFPCNTALDEYSYGNHLHNSMSDNISKISAPNIDARECCYDDNDGDNIPSESQYMSRQQQLDDDDNDKNRIVRFGTVSIRHYERILTVNPSTVEGPSIGIGWNFVQDDVISLYRYEHYIRNNHNNNARRPSFSLVLNRQAREDLLMNELGYTPRELANAVRSNKRVRNQRRQTVQNLKVQRLEEAVETVKGQCLKIFSRSSKNKLTAEKTNNPIL
mmetsp:Transcript_30747/g.45493  ORF Transcript_30747/g.45493 Transcript_30747/m.45493 type:complete len:420 (-) Transcript_30747:2390-3649(-)